MLGREEKVAVEYKCYEGGKGKNREYLSGESSEVIRKVGNERLNKTKDVWKVIGKILYKFKVPT